MTRTATFTTRRGLADDHGSLQDAAPPDLTAAMKTEQVGIERALRRQGLPASLHVRTLGVGARAADRWAASLDGRACPSALVSMGFACGLNDACQLGHVVLSQGLLAEREKAVFHSDPQLLEMAAQACQQVGMPYHMGASLTVLKPALSSAQKENYGRQTGALSCAMEDYWLAREAHRVGVPFLSARVILDPVAQDLPAAIGELAECQGVTLALRVLAQSWRLPLLVRLAHQGNQAQRRLGAFATTLCPQLMPAVGSQSTLSPGGTS